MNRIGPILSRFIENLMSPLSRKECLPSELDEVDASFSNLKSYVKFVSLSIRMFHLHERSSHNALQSFIKTILSQALKSTQSSETAEEGWAWGKYLLQHVIFSVL